MSYDCDKISINDCKCRCSFETVTSLVRAIGEYGCDTLVGILRSRQEGFIEGLIKCRVCGGIALALIQPDVIFARPGSSTRDIGQFGAYVESVLCGELLWVVVSGTLILNYYNTAHLYFKFSVLLFSPFVRASCHSQLQHQALIICLVFDVTIL